jgi:Tfp pilus assembly protein PilF
MSLINQMLADLEARKGGNLRHADSAIDGLQAATMLPRPAPEHLRPALGGLLIVAALAALWATREPLFALLSARDAEVVAPVIRSGAPPAVEAPKAVILAPPPVALDQLPALPSTPVVVLEAPPVDIAPPVDTRVEAAPAVMPTRPVPSAAPAVQAPPLEPAVPARTATPPAVPADLAPVYLSPETGEESATAPATASRLTPLAGDPAVEYPGSFRREQTTTPAATPAARRYAEITSLFANGRRDAALSMLRSFVAAEPAREDARQRLALELIADGQRGAAEELLRAGLAPDPSSAALARPLAHLLLAQDKAEAAIAVLRPATPPLAGHADFHALLAAAEQRIGAHGLAITRYRGLLKEQPLNGGWLVALGISLLAVGEDADAISAFARALDDRALAESLRAYATRELVRLKDRQP